MKTLAKTLAVTLAMTFVGIAGPLQSASAWLKICNGTTESITYAHTYIDTAGCSGNPNYCSNWEKNGWYNIAPDTCQTVYSGSAAGRYFYYYAQAYDGWPRWSGSGWNWQHTSSGHTQCMPSQPWSLYSYCADEVNYGNNDPSYNHGQLAVPSQYANYYYTLNP